MQLLSSVPKKTSHSTSSQRNVPAKFMLFQFKGFGKKNKALDTLSVNKMYTIIPMKAASYLIPSY